MNATLYAELSSVEDEKMAVENVPHPTMLISQPMYPVMNGGTLQVDFGQDGDRELLGRKLRELRKKKRLTQDQLAELIGTKKSYISRIENGHADIQLSSLLRLVRAMDKSVTFTIY